MRSHSGLFGACLGVLIGGAVFFDDSGSGQPDQVALDDVTSAYAANFAVDAAGWLDRLGPIADGPSLWALSDRPVVSD